MSVPEIWKSEYRSSGSGTRPAAPVARLSRRLTLPATLSRAADLMIGDGPWDMDFERCAPRNHGRPLQKLGLRLVADARRRTRSAPGYRRDYRRGYAISTRPRPAVRQLSFGASYSVAIRLMRCQLPNKPKRRFVVGSSFAADARMGFEACTKKWRNAVVVVAPARRLALHTGFIAAKRWRTALQQHPAVSNSRAFRTMQTSRGDGGAW